MLNETAYAYVSTVSKARGKPKWLADELEAVNEAITVHEKHGMKDPPDVIAMTRAMGHRTSHLYMTVQKIVADRLDHDSGIAVATAVLGALKAIRYLLIVAGEFPFKNAGTREPVVEKAEG